MIAYSEYSRTWFQIPLLLAYFFFSLVCDFDPLLAFRHLVYTARLSVSGCEPQGLRLLIAGISNGLQAAQALSTHLYVASLNLKPSLFLARWLLNYPPFFASSREWFPREKEVQLGPSKLKFVWRVILRPFSSKQDDFSNHVFKAVILRGSCHGSFLIGQNIV